MGWPVLTLLAIVLVDYISLEHRQQAAFDLVKNYLTQHVHIAKHAVEERGLAALEVNDLVEDTSLDTYVCNDSQEALTKPRYARTGAVITNKSIVRCFGSEYGDVHSWLSPSDYRGVPVVCAYTLARVGDELVAVIAEVDQSEVSVDTTEWWFFADAAWIFVFASIAGVCLLFHRKDIIRLVRDVKPDDCKIDAGSLLIRFIREFPDASVGVAEVKEDGSISNCSSSFAKIVGAFAVREVVGTGIRNYVTSIDVDDVLSSEATEAPFICKCVDGKEIGAILSSVKIADTLLITIRR